MSSSNSNQPTISTLESNLATMSITDSEQPAVSSENSIQATMPPESSNQAATSSEGSEQPETSSEDPNHHNATALSLITDMHTFLATNPNNPLSHARIATRWALLTRTYRLSAAFVRTHKDSLGGSWPADNTLPPPPPNLHNTATSKNHIKVTTAFIAAARDLSKHSHFVESMGRDALAVPPGPDQKWEQNFLAWRVMREQSTLDALEKKCELLNQRMMRSRRKRDRERRAAGDHALWERCDPVLREFLRVHVKMEEVEGAVKEFLGRGTGEDGGKGKVGEKGLGMWRVWPNGEGCVMECLVRNVRGGA